MAMRWIWVSTGKTAWSWEKSRTQLAVLADAGEIEEVTAGVEHRQGGEVVETDLAVLGSELAEDCLDARGFLVAQAADADAAGDFFGGGIGNFVPRAEMLPELSVAGTRVGIAGVLGKDGADEDGDGVAVADPWARAVGEAELFEDP
jgi:hypothetical protein